MRLLRMLCCLLLLAAMAAAQSSSTTSSSSSQTPAGQAPQNPLQEPSKDQQQQQQQAAEAQRGQPSSFEVSSGASAGAEDQELGEMRMMTRYSQIGGEPTGRARSFHQEGSNNLAEFNYFLDRRFFATAHRFQILSMFRGTDDSSIDPEKNSLQKAYLRIYGPRDEYIFGDALVNYSRLTFNQNIKGLSTSWKLNSAWKLSAVGGVFIDRYGSLFKEQPEDCFPPPGGVASTSPQCGRPFTSAVTGARLEYAFARDSALGFNFSSSKDMTFTRRDRPFNESPLPAANSVGSVDLKWQWHGLRTDSEIAYSLTNFDVRPGDCVMPCDSRVPTPGLGSQGDFGGRFEASYRWKKLSFRTSYLRFEPAFASINARQIADLQDFLFRTSYDVTSWLTLDGVVRRSNDSLKQQNPYEKVLWGPEGRLIFHDLPFYRRGVFEVGYRHRIIDGSSDTIPLGGLVAGCVAMMSGTGMVCVDRFVRTPYAEFTVPVSTTFLTLGYERRQTVDALQPGGTSNVDRVYVALRGIYDLDGWHINPSLRYELERQGSRPGLNNVLPGGAPTAIDLLMERDSNRLSTAALFVEAPRWFIIELAFRDNSATSGCVELSAASPICTPAVSFNGYSRPSYKASLTYKLRNDENKVFIFSFERNSNFYFDNTSLPGGTLNALNFDERIAGVTFVYKFGRRSR